MKRLFLAALVLIPAFAFAQETLAPPPSIWETLAAQFLSPAGIATIVGTLASVIFGFWKFSDLRRQQVATAAYYAFHAVEDIAATTATDIDDKVAAGLRALDQYMLTNGWRPLKPGETALAQAHFQALNGQMKAQEKVQAGALAIASAQGVSSPPTP